MKKVLVFGARGMAGHVITLYLSKLKDKYNITNVCNKQSLNDDSILCDISDIRRVTKLIELNNPDVIINCVGILNKDEYSDIQNMTYVNTFFPRFLARFGETHNIKIIHLSTDCVFDGKIGNYTEKSFKSENGIYGLSKNLGEIDSKNCITIRTSIIGPELKDGSGLFNWFMKQSNDINGFSNVYWTGITTLELAKVVDKLIDEDINGIYNIVPDYKISKYELLNIIKNVFSKTNINIIKNSDVKSDKSLISSKLKFSVSTYESMIIEMRDWILENKSIYSRYLI